MKKYEQILHDLENKILNGDIAENSLLPSENELTQQFQASRSTVRQALKILETQGLIQKQQGRGSVVISREKVQFPISGLTSYRELQEAMHFDSMTDVVGFELMMIDAKLADKTHLPEHHTAFHILRRRKIDDAFVVLDEDFILSDVAPGLELKHAQNSIYAYLEDELGLTIAYAQKEITIDFAHHNDRQYLDLNPDDRHVVSVKNHVYLSDNTPFQFTESRHQVDKFRFVEFARRAKR
jgi:GntR family trehalose operon transcriptional repressor